MFCVSVAPIFQLLQLWLSPIQWHSRTFGCLVRWSNLPPYCLRFWKVKPDAVKDPIKPTIALALRLFLLHLLTYETYNLKFHVIFFTIFANLPPPSKCRLVRPAPRPPSLRLCFHLIDDIWVALSYWARRYDSAICCSNMSKNGNVAAANNFIVLSCSLTERSPELWSWSTGWQRRLSELFRAVCYVCIHTSNFHKWIRTCLFRCRFSVIDFLSFS